MLYTHGSLQLNGSLLFSAYGIVVHYVCALNVDSNEDIHQLLCNTNLQKLIEDINQSSNPQELLEKAMSLPLFRDFADQCIAHCRK